MSNAIAVREKIALAAAGLAKSRRIGNTLKSVVAHMALRGVCVHLLIRPRYPRSGKPERLLSDVMRMGA